MLETSKTKRVIVNADDLGFSPGVTDGILRAHAEGIVTSTTIAANMPAAAQAVKRLAEAPDLGVGVHLNASQGPALSGGAAAPAGPASPPSGQAAGGPDGVMNRTATAVILACLRRPAALDAIEAEFDAQIRWVLDHGIRPTHLDSHRHAHGFPPIFARVARLARRYHIPFVRWCREALPPGGWPPAPGRQRRNSRMLSCLARVNAAIAPELRATRGTWGLMHTGFIDAGWFVRAARGVRAGVTELMVHPAAAIDVDPGMTRLLECRRVELDALCDPAVRKAFQKHGIDLTHYGRLG